MPGKRVKTMNITKYLVVFLLGIALFVTGMIFHVKGFDPCEPYQVYKKLSRSSRYGWVTGSYCPLNKYFIPGAILAVVGVITAWGSLAAFLMKEED